MSPILVRPVREQLEHDRVIRLLLAKYKRKFQVAINPGQEQGTPVTIRGAEWYPDLLLQTSDARPRLLGVVEVETAESVNHLEAMSQWATFAHLRVPLHLYVPVSSVDAARRLCASLRISVSEVWAYNALDDEILFTLVHRLSTQKAQALRSSKAATPKRKAVPRRTTAGRTAPRRAAAPRPATRKTATRKAAAPKAAARKTARPRTAARKAAGKKRSVARTQAPRKATRVAKKSTKKNVRSVARSTGPTKAARSVRPTRTAGQASKSSRPKKR